MQITEDFAVFWFYFSDTNGGSAVIVKPKLI